MPQPAGGGDDKGPMFIAATSATGLDELAPPTTLRAGPAELAAVATRSPIGRSDVPKAPPCRASSLVRRTAAEALKAARRPLIVAGRTWAARAHPRRSHIAWSLTRAGRDARLCYTASECTAWALP